jgi:cbb3-type cytochrome oxidase subunit 1
MCAMRYATVSPELFKLNRERLRNLMLKNSLVVVNANDVMPTNADGTLTYAFVEGVKATYPFYAIRLVGGTLFLAGMLLMAWNVMRTIAAGKAADAEIPLGVGMVPAAA